MIWRHSSEPMEPPAPVTRMDFAAMQALSSAGFGGTGSRPSRSCTSMSRLFEPRLPEMISPMSGRSAP
jgi:hypothetical protein